VITINNQQCWPGVEFIKCVAQKGKRHKTHKKFISYHHHPIGLRSRLHTHRMMFQFFSFMDHDILALYNLRAEKLLHALAMSQNFPKNEKQTVVSPSPHQRLCNTSGKRKTAHKHENALNVSPHSSAACQTFAIYISVENEIEFS
jgi:hypothetical protein